MPFYHIQYGVLHGFDNWKTYFKINLLQNELIEWLVKYYNGDLFYHELDGIYQTENKLIDEHNIWKKGTKITELINWHKMIPEKEKVKVDRRKVFIVHGRDEKPVYELAYVLQHHVGLIPIILKEQDDGGDTIIEKFEKNSDVSYAFIILTPDDVGSLESDQKN